MKDFEEPMSNMIEEINGVKQDKNAKCLAEVFGIQNKEVYITKWLAYLLSQPSIGEVILRAFMQIINDETIINEKYEVYSEYYLGAAGRIDIYIESDNYIIGIENKIWASEGEKQTTRYWDELKKNKDKKIILIYLHPEMNPSIPECDKFSSVTYTELVNKLKDYGIDIPNEPDGLDRFLYNEFIKYVEVCLSMKYPEISKKAEIYQKYLESIQSAKDEYTDYTNRVESWIVKMIEETGYKVGKHSDYWQIYKSKWLDINFHFELLWDGDFVNSKEIRIQAHLEGNNIKKDKIRSIFGLDDNKPHGTANPLIKHSITDYDFKNEDNAEKFIDQIVSILESEEFSKYADYAEQYLNQSGI